MQFAQPLWIAAGFIFCTATLLFIRTLQKQRQATLKKFAGTNLLTKLTRHVSKGRRRLKNSLLLLAIFCLFVALARPQYGYIWVDVKRKGIDILFAIDTSKSMLAEDLKPNRLQRAKFGIMDFVAKLEGDRIGLMPFAGTGYLMCPLTLDYDAFGNSLGSIDTNIIPTGGTNISAVLNEAEKVLHNDANHKILILLTDGENLQGDVIEAAKQAAEKGLTVYTVGVGTAEGELIPFAAKGKSGFIQDESGKYITSKLDEKTLQEIAETTDGIYVPLGGGEGLETIYQQKLHLIPKEELAERRHRIPIDRFSWPLTAGLILLVLEFLIPERRSNRKLSFPKIKTAGRRIKKISTPFILLFCFMHVPMDSLHASEAEDAYNREEYLKASELYSKALKEHPDNPALHYNYGTTAYKNNLFDNAIGSFTEALKSEDLSLQEKAYYNLGNAHFQKGMESAQAKPKETEQQWQQAIESYDNALQLNPDDSLAEENRRFVQQKLEELQEQMKQQQENQEQNDQQNNDNKQDESGEKNEQQQNQGSDQQQEQQSDSGQQQNDKQGKSDQNEQVNEQEKSAKEETGNEEQEQQPQPAQQEENSEEKEGAAGQTTDQDAEKNKDLERRELGKMTKEEAENLLNALKNEEGELNFVPGGRQEDIRRDW